jgi:phosphoglycerate dehydrogenase-like enzyme
MISLGVLSTDDFFKHALHINALRKDFEVHDFRDWEKFDEKSLLERCRSVEVLIIGWHSPKLPKELAQDRGKLRYVCHLRGSIRKYIDKELVVAGLVVTNWGDDVEYVAEGAMTLLLCQLKQIPALDKFIKGGPDERIYQMFPSRLKNLDVGLYGFGPIGRHMARMLEPFGAKIAIYDPFAKDVPAHIRRCSTLKELFSTCPVISIHCGLNDQTRGSVNREMLELLPEGGVLINTARGHIVDEAALAELVQANRISAGIDVIQDEKNWPGSPLAPLKGAILTGHKINKGKGYPPGKEPILDLPEHLVKNLEAYRSGKPLINIISAEIYDLKT